MMTRFIIILLLIISINKVNAENNDLNSNSINTPKAKSKTGLYKGIVTEHRGYAVDVKKLTSNGTVQPFESYSYSPKDMDNIIQISENSESNLRPYALVWNADKSKLYGFSRNDEARYYLMSVNPSNGVATQLAKLTGFTANESPQGMAIDESDQCFVITTDSENHNTVSTLYTCNLSTGALTLIGSQSAAPDLHDITATCDGEMFGIDSYGEALYKIDKTDASATLIGPLDIGTLNFFDLEFDRKNKILYQHIWSDYSSALAKINMSTGKSTFVSGSFVSGLLVGAIKSSCSDEPDILNINTRFNGSWYNPQTGGQGFLFDVLAESNTFFAAWFTFDQTSTTTNKASIIGSSDQRWLTAQGPLGEGNSVDLNIYNTSGGIFNDPTSVGSEIVGSMTINFNDCASGSIDYYFNGSELNGSIPIKRLAYDNIDLCESMNQ